MNIVILDPGLRDLTGHHFDFVRKADSYLRSQGHRVTIYCHQSASRDVLCQFSNIVPHFRSFPYPQFHGEILDYHHHSQLIAEDLENIPHADRAVWPSVFSFHMNGSRISNKFISVGCVHVEHHFHHDVYGAAQWTHAIHDNFKLFAIEHKLVADYVDIGVPCTYAPNPADNTPIEGPRSKLKTIGFFGHQRADKGSSRIFNMVSELVSAYNIVWHDSAGGARYDHPNVTCYGSVPVLSDIIRTCDLVILPYDRTKYKKMSSGIMCESLSVGIPCVVPSGTTQADWIESTGSGIAFDIDIIQAIKKAHDNYPHIAQCAYNTAVEWPHKYGIEKFMSTMLRLENI
jgi:hypothetical protein